MLKALFVSEKESSLASLAIGHGVLSILPNNACAILAYYLQFLHGHDGQCYAIVMHSFFLRFIYDFGIMGLIIYVLSLYLIIRRFYNRAEAVVIMAPSLLCGFSVGGFYNILTALALLISIDVKIQSRRLTIPQLA